MNRLIAAFAAGLVFGIGLVVAQMTNPAKVIGFLDITGAWDPSLALVMAGAIAVYAPVYWMLRARGVSPALVPEFHPPHARQIDRRLVFGALIFGAGWGLGGFCPGPAITSAGFGEPKVWVFVAAMLAGMMAYRLRAQPVLARPAAAEED
jgi:hypothetical protein